MFRSSLFRKQPVSFSRRSRPFSIRPTLETLEDRSLPSVDLGWALGIGGVKADQAYDLANDASGNLYLAGSFREQVDFDPDPVGSYTFTSQHHDIFVAKYGPDGSFRWASQFGGAGIDNAIALTTDATGNIYVAGQFQGTVTFGNITLPGTPSPSETDMFILRLTPDTANPDSYSVTWAKHWVGTPSWVDLKADAHGNIYVTGQSGIGFVRKLDAATGSTLAENNVVAGMGIAISNDGNRVFVTGEYAGTVDFDPAASHAGNTDVLTSIGRRGSYYDDVFVLELDSDLNFQWVGSVGGPNIDTAEDILVDDAGIYVMGTYPAGPSDRTSDFDFDPGPGKYSLPIFDASGNFLSGGLFILKLSPDHTFEWVNGIVGPDHESRAGYNFGALALDAAGNVYASDVFESGVNDFDVEDSYADGRDLHSLAGGNELFVAKYDRNGYLNWVETMGSTLSELPGGVVVNADGGVYVAGTFEDSATFNPDSAPTTTLTSNGFRDILLARLEQTAETTPTIGISSVTKAEGNNGTTIFTFVVTLSQASTETVTVNFSTANGTATAGSDYTATSGTLTFLPGETTKMITVIVLGDTTKEVDESFYVNLSGAVGALLVDAQGIGLITNDDTKGGKN